MRSAALADFLARAREECPGLELEDDVLVAHLASIYGELATVELGKLRAGELRLVVACMCNDPRALEQLERNYLRELVEVVRAADPTPALAEEVVQCLRSKLLVAEGDTPARLARFGGTGPLGGWLRVAALREAIDRRRSGWREVPVEDGLVRVADPARSPELVLMRAEHAAAMRQALVAAIANQPSRMRTLLRYYYVDRVGVEELGRIYRVHASTVSRWLSATRRAVYDETRRLLASTLALGESDVESMLGLSASIELSLDTLLRSSD